jgi:hypothetical protein
MRCDHLADLHEWCCPPAGATGFCTYSGGAGTGVASSLLARAAEKWAGAEPARCPPPRDGTGRRTRPASGERAEGRILHGFDLRRPVLDVGRIGDLGTYWERGPGRRSRGRVTVSSRHCCFRRSQQHVVVDGGRYCCRRRLLRVSLADHGETLVLGEVGEVSGFASRVPLTLRRGRLWCPVPRRGAVIPRSWQRGGCRAG